MKIFEQVELGESESEGEEENAEDHYVKQTKE